jgi:hypothetical protein
MPSYNWNCLACNAYCAAFTDFCEGGGCPAESSVAEQKDYGANLEKGGLVHLPFFHTNDFQEAQC